MKKFALAVATATGLVAATLGLAAPVVATPSDGESAQDTVNRLESEGFRVILDKVGSGALDQCTVTAVRPGQDVTEPGTSRIGSRDPVQHLLYTTVYVDVQC